MKRNAGLIVFVIVGCAMLLVACDLLLGTETLLPRNVLPSEEEPHLVMVRSRVHVGDERSKVIQALSDAWYRADCRYPDGSGEELFFYGARNRDKAKIVLIHYMVVSERVTVDFIGSVENYMLHLYERCLPSQIFDEE